jgi:DNA invertase Pin-like site-specific DNA recombinase
MSTEHQQYSPKNQSDAIAQYAALHQLEIVQTYADHGRSGLNLAGRQGLLTLLDDVAEKRNVFSVLLVYDISRWGRFQDADESAYYEYVLKKAGIRIHYCAEQFVNDGSLQSILFKTLKRTMAGEYSRELSVKVFAGQCRLIELGYRQGGLPGYALRRQLLDMDGTPKTRLAEREHKNLQTDRVILVPGPEAEVTIVASIYRSFISSRKGETEIAADLNAQGVKTHLGKPWANFNVHEVLVNPKYIGVNLYNRSSFKLKQKRVRNPPEMWIKREKAFEAIVSREDFKTVQAILDDRIRAKSDQELLDGLLHILKTHGRLSYRIVDEAASIPTSQTYARRFGSLTRAYALIGWRSERDCTYVEANRTVEALRSALLESIVQDIRRSGATIDTSDRKGLLTINQEFTASIHVERCYQRPNGHQWRVKIDHSRGCDVSLVARMNAGNDSILDYYVFPSNEIRVGRLRLRPSNPLSLDVYRFENLDLFLGLCRRKPLEGVFHEARRDRQHPYCGNPYHKPPSSVPGEVDGNCHKHPCRWAETTDYGISQNRADGGR